MDGNLARVREQLKGSSVDLELLARKIDVLAEVVASGVWDRLSLYTVAYFILALAASIALGLFVGSSADFQRPSFVLLTKTTVEHRRTALSDLERRPSRLALGALGALALSVLGNYVFYLIVKMSF